MKTSFVFEWGKICYKRYLSSFSQSAFLADHRKSTEVFQHLPAWGRSLHQRHPQQEDYRSNLVLDRLGLWESNEDAIYTNLWVQLAQSDHNHLMIMNLFVTKNKKAIQRMALCHTTSSSFREWQSPDGLTDILPVYLSSLLSRKRTRGLRDDCWSASTVYWKAGKKQISLTATSCRTWRLNVKQHTESYILHDNNI